MKPIHYIIALAVTSLDLLTKGLVLSRLGDNNPKIEILPGFFDIILVRNSGIAFGMLHDVDSPWKPVILSVIALLALGAITYYGRLTESSSRWLPVVLGVVMGGILGNFLDRVYNGSVVDFLDVYWRSHHWPAFNVADSAITIGTIALLLDSFRSRPVS